MKLRQTARSLWQQQGQVLSYLFFGGLTTLVNYAVYLGATRLIPGMSVSSATIVAWILSVLFAYLTNRRWVFHSQASGAGELLREIRDFVAARLLTGAMDWVIMVITVDALELDDRIMKLLSNIVVIVLNYIFSKYLVFGRKTS